VRQDAEIYSATDPEYFADRRVWYWVTLNGKSVGERRNDWATVNARARALVEEHDGCLIDRSDKGSGYLLSALGR
jgi:hypothetical protein